MNITAKKRASGPSGRHRTVPIPLRGSAEFKADIREAAEFCGVTVQEWITRLILAELRKTSDR